MPTSIDHVVILVEDLDTAVQQYRDIGFTVTPGGKHARFTHNALVPFQDGSYLELIAFYEHPAEGAAETHRWYRWLAKGGGIIDFALAEDDLTAFIADAGQRGLQYTGPHPGQRARPDGQQLRWSMAQVSGPNTGALPFLIHDISDRGLRVPLENAEHANGVTGIQTLTVAVQDIEAASQRYQLLLQSDGSNGTFAVGPHHIHLAAASADGDLAQQVADRGDSPYALAFLAPSAQTIDPKSAGGARLSLVTA